MDHFSTPSLIPSGFKYISGLRISSVFPHFKNITLEVHLNNAKHPIHVASTKRRIHSFIHRHPLANKHPAVTRVWSLGYLKKKIKKLFIGALLLQQISVLRGAAMVTILFIRINKRRFIFSYLFSKIKHVRCRKRALKR